MWAFKYRCQWHFIVSKVNAALRSVDSSKLHSHKRCVFVSFVFCCFFKKKKIKSCGIIGSMFPGILLLC